MRKLIIFTLFISGGLLAQSPDRIIKDVDKKLKSAETIKVHFKETYVWTLTGESQSIEGKLWMQGEDRFYVDTDDQIIVSDGTTLWTYSKPAHRVLIDELDGSEGAMLPRQILLQYTKEYASRLEGEEVLAGKPCYHLSFTSETGETLVASIHVWIDKKESVPRRIEQTGLDGNQNIYDILSFELDAVIDDGLFSYQIPEDADVIDMR